MKLTNSNIWLTSDTHYAHTNICKGVSNWDFVSRPDSVRDFKNLSQMNDAIVNNINAKVGKDDTLIHVGDWSFGGFENIELFRSRIVCENIHLILGNHDHHIKHNKGDVKDLFTTVGKMEEITIAKKLFVFCHYPLDSWEEMRRGTYMIHGHVHTKGDQRFGHGRKMDVGIDGSPDFAPYHIDDIFRILEKRVNVDERH
jgi:calcineurin-like phosphoesterase family protein